MDGWEKIASYIAFALAVLITAAVIFAFLVIIRCEFGAAVFRLLLPIILVVSAIRSCGRAK